MSFKLDITGFKKDKLKISKEEFDLVMNGFNLKWLDNWYHVWPSMNHGEGHICSFEVDRIREWNEKKK